MSMLFIPGLVAFLVCAGTLPAVKRIARRLNLYDGKGALKIHQGQISRLGGIAMMAGLMTGCLPFLPSTTNSSVVTLSIFGGVWLIGLIDDLSSLPPKVRLAFHLAAGATFWLAGWRLNWFAPVLLDLSATCLFVAFLISAMNLLDGMDGLAASLAAVVSFGFLGISVSSGKGMAAVVASSLLGVSLGMLTANFPPATIFMGDSGSTFIGVILAFLCLDWVRTQPDRHSIEVPLIFLTVPLADAILAIFRRAGSQAALFTGDRRHFYDLLLQRGWPARRVLGATVGITGILVLAGWWSARSELAIRFTAVTIVSGVAVAAHVLGSTQSEADPRGRDVKPLG